MLIVRNSLPEDGQTGLLRFHETKFRHQNLNNKLITNHLKKAKETFKESILVEKE